MAKNTSVNQYKSLFFATWIISYIIFPAWALPVPVNVRAAVFAGLIIYFFISAVMMNRWFNAVPVDRPVFVRTKNWTALIKDNLLLVVACCIAVVLHIRPLSLPILIMGDEALHLTNGLWIYEYIDRDWHRVFQISFWVVTGLLVAAGIFRAHVGSVLKKVKEKFSGSTSAGSLKYLFIFLGLIVSFIYFFLLKDMTYSFTLIRYPPIGKLLYLLIYSGFGIDSLFPRIAQLIFYLLCAIYLYRIILLFHEKQTALLGAAIYLFLPISFAYGYLGELESGVVFSIVAICYYFLRFMKDGDNRDLLLSAYLIGFGFLYKDPALLVFPVCFIFLAYHKIRRTRLISTVHLKILSLALVPAVPWMLMTRTFSWRNYTFVLSNVTSFEGKIADYFSLLSLNLSEIVFILFVLSFFYLLFFKRNTLTVFFGLLFMVYYFFIISDIGAISPRFSMAFYPTITVFVSLFIASMAQYIRWKQLFKTVAVALVIYLAVVSSMLPPDNHFLTVMNRKLQYFPGEEAMEWVKEHVKQGQKIMIIRVMSADFYSIKYDIDEDRIVNFWDEFTEVDTPIRLKAFYKENKISYIMFPAGPSYPYQGQLALLKYLRDDPDKQFVEIARFSKDDNSIVICSMKEN